jgi:hypothetical protein
MLWVNATLSNIGDFRQLSAKKFGVSSKAKAMIFFL